MSESCSSALPERIPDPREVLDGIKRTKILALLAMGCSRRMAAKQVGCAPSTITRTAERDEEFHGQLGDAEAKADIRALRLITHAADQEKYWRVAAWLLERRHPEEYGRRAPHTFTGSQVMDLLVRGLREIVQAVKKENLPDVMMFFHDLITDVAEKANLLPIEPKELIAATMPPPPAKLDDECPDSGESQENSSVDQPHEYEAAPVAVAEQPPKPVNGAGRNGSAKPLRDAAPSLRPASPFNGTGHGATAPDRSIPVPRRASCLEQFVTRSPNAELETVGA